MYSVEKHKFAGGSSQQQVLTDGERNVRLNPMHICICLIPKAPES